MTLLHDLGFERRRNAELVNALKALVDVLVRCDAEKMPSDLEQCTDEEWNAALVRAQAVLAKVA